MELLRPMIGDRRDATGSSLPVANSREGASSNPLLVPHVVDDVAASAGGWREQESPFRPGFGISTAFRSSCGPESSNLINRFLNLPGTEGTCCVAPETRGARCAGKITWLFVGSRMLVAWSRCVALRCTQSRRWRLSAG